MLTIFAALSNEIRLIKSEMEVDKAIRIRPFTIHIGTYLNKRITLVRTGIGKGPMESAISYCTKNLDPTLLINIGYAGGLDPHLENADIVIANSIIDEASEKTFTPEQNLIDKAVSLATAHSIKYHTGRMITVDEALVDPHQKAFTGTKFEAMAVDMESAPFADIATTAKIPFLVVRSILDPLDTELPHIPKDVLSDGDVQIGPLMEHLKSNPKDILKLPKSSYLCNRARISMTNFIKEWIKSE